MEQDRQGIEVEKILQHADIKGKAVLEVGCGDGRATAFLAPLAGSLTAIDPDETRLSRARARLPGVDFRLGSGERMGFPDHCFDAVLFTFSLHHQDCARALDEAHRVLRDSGVAVVVEPAPHGDMHLLFGLFKEEDRQITEARETVMNGRFPRCRSESFEIEYIFDDARELHDYFFGNYGMERDAGLIEKMNTILGARKSDRPIPLTEAINIFSLSKT